MRKWREQGAIFFFFNRLHRIDFTSLPRFRPTLVTSPPEYCLGTVHRTNVHAANIFVPAHGAYNKQSNEKKQCSRLQKLTRSTHKNLTNFTLWHRTCRMASIKNIGQNKGSLINTFKQQRSWDGVKLTSLGEHFLYSFTDIFLCDSMKTSQYRIHTKNGFSLTIWEGGIQACLSMASRISATLGKK